MLKIKDISIDNRPRERLVKYGAPSLSDAELLAIILRVGSQKENVMDLSNRLLNKFDLLRLADCSVSELCTNAGIGTAKACQIIAAFELGRRLTSYSRPALPLLDNPQAVVKLLKAKLRDKKKEHLIGLYLDTENKLIKEKTISIGILNSSLVHPREIFKAAIRESARSLIIAHNHPSGNPSPSKEDMEITHRLVKIGTLMDIPLIDHIIIGFESFYSFAQEKKI